jgi:uncharacterized protein
LEEPNRVDALDLATTNLTSPPILAFALGIIAALIRSDLRLPEPIYIFLSIYLLLGIGLKGGVALSETSFAEIWAPALATLVIGIAIPLWIYPFLRKVGRFSISDAAAIGAHYGSVSVVTFTAAIAFLDLVEEPYEAFMPTLVALLEVPAIVVALMLAKMRLGGGDSFGSAMQEVLSGRSIVLLAGGVAIGLIAGVRGAEQVEPLFVDLFVGVLFLLEMGIAAGRRIGDLRDAGVFLVTFAIVVPVLHGAVGVVVGNAVGLSTGGSTVFAVLIASASYIAAPAAVRIALPDANPGYYLTAALAITFPFNLAVGVPLYYQFATWLS